MDPKIDSTLQGFQSIYLDGIPLLLKDKKSSFLSFLCVVAAIDSLSGYRYSTKNNSQRFEQFIKSYFPSQYLSHVSNLYLFRCRMLHNSSPAFFSLTHGSPALHLTQSNINDPILSDEVFFAHMKAAAEKYIAELSASTALQADLLTRLNNIQAGGAIFVN